MISPSQKSLNIFLFLLFLFLISIQFVQFGSYTLDGDITSICLPIETYQSVFDDPFGFKLLKSNPKLYSGTNRFFCTYICSYYLNHMPILCQYITSPIDSLFLSIQLFKLCTLLLGIFVLFKYVSVFCKNSTIDNMLIYCLILVLFQNEGFYEQIGIIDHSIIYTFYYGFSILLIFLLFYPFVASYYHCQSLDISSYQWIYVIPLMIIVPFFGSINAPFVLFTMIFSFLFFLRRYVQRPSCSSLTRNMLLGFFLLCIYSQYLSYFNLENPTIFPSISERYFLLAKGIIILFRKSFGLVFLIVIIGVNTYFLDIKTHTNLRKGIFFVFLFSTSYLFLLPMGGYRAYRPYVVRYDNFIPITLLIFIVFLVTSIRVYPKLTISDFLKRGALILFVLFFSYSNFHFCVERSHTESQIKLMQQSANFNVKINRSVKILNWEYIDKPENSYYASLMLRRWNIIKRDFRFYQ